MLPDNVFLNAFKSHLVRIFTQMFQMYYKEHAADKMEEMKILYKLWIIRVDERVLGLIKHCIKGHCKVDIETSLHPTSMNLVRQGYLALGMSQQEINIKVFKWKPPRSHHEKNPKDRREKINPVSSQKI